MFPVIFPLNQSIETYGIQLFWVYNHVSIGQQKLMTHDMFNRHIVFQNDFLYVFLLVVSQVYINFQEIALRGYRQIPILSINPRVQSKTGEPSNSNSSSD